MEVGVVRMREEGNMEVGVVRMREGRWTVEGVYCSGGGGVDAEGHSEVEMGMGAESFSSTAYSGTCGRHGQWKDSKIYH